MRKFLKFSLVWQFTGGFVLGTIGLLAFQPADARVEFARHFVPSHEVRR